MAQLSDIAQISIIVSPTGVKVETFDKLLIADQHSVFAERVRSYASADDAVTDGFTEGSAIVRALRAAFAQNPAPNVVKVGRMANLGKRRFNVAIPADADVETGQVYTITVFGKTAASGQDASFTVGVTETQAALGAGLEAAVDALALDGITSTYAAGVLSIDAAAAEDFLGIDTDLAITETNVAGVVGNLADDLAAIKIADGDWYGLSVLRGAIAEGEAVGAWVESNKKLCILSESNTTAINGGSSLASELQTDNYFRSKSIYRRDSSHFPAVAWLARNLTIDPGRSTFEYQPLAGEPAEQLSTTQQANLEGVNGSAVLDYGGKFVTHNSKVAAGEWLDVIRDRDWFEVRMQQEIVNLTLRMSALGKKLPFTDGGAASLESVVRQVLNEGIKADFLSPDVPEGQDDPFIINVPRARDVSNVNRQARRFGPITFSANIAGAIFLTTLNGIVSV